MLKEIAPFLAWTNHDVPLNLQGSFMVWPEHQLTPLFEFEPIIGSCKIHYGLSQCGIYHNLSSILHSMPSMPPSVSSLLVLWLFLPSACNPFLSILFQSPYSSLQLLALEL
jgi:hypothetical protein